MFFIFERDYVLVQRIRSFYRYIDASRMQIMLLPKTRPKTGRNLE